MSELMFNLSENATRQGIYADLLSRFDERKREALKVELANAGVPDKHHHDLTEVIATIDALSVSTAVKCDARAIYRILADAEAQVHGCPVEKTHFHEVGKGEAICNVIGICLAIEALNPSKIKATPVQVGKGKIQCAHGLLDIPAPATAAILARGIPVCDTYLDGELCTPTSAAIIFHFVEEFTV